MTQLKSGAVDEPILNEQTDVALSILTSHSNIPPGMSSRVVPDPKTVHNGPSKTQEQNGPFARALGHGPPSKFRRPQRHEQHKENPAQLVSSRQAAESVDTPPPRSPSCEFELKFSNLSLRPASASPLETPAP